MPISHTGLRKLRQHVKLFEIASIRPMAGVAEMTSGRSRQEEFS